ncbi:MAG: hypothetical protein CMA84_02700 [Euryarchaeota archaeon]|nr:hypothetical protein [Euryarchaeota archaeon]
MRFVKRGRNNRLNMAQAWYRQASFIPALLVVMAVLIITFGGTIRIYDAGESCPDWPGCFGTWHFMVSEAEQAAYWDENPDQIDSRGADHRYTIFEIFLEWVHRLLVGIIAIPMLWNMYSTQKNKNRWGREIRNASWIAGFFLVVQAIAGAITVIYDNSDWSVALHLSLALTFTGFLVWQCMLHLKREGHPSFQFSTPPDFVDSEKKRIFSLTLAVFVLLILGTWVASTAGGEYNKGCSIGMPDGWPQCQGELLPSFEHTGILVQMLHRVGAAIVGVILVLGTMKIKDRSMQYTAPKIYGKCLEFATGFWLLNIFVGGLYIVLADADGFPELLSLTHLIIGVSSFFSALMALMLIRLSSSAGGESDE